MGVGSYTFTWRIGVPGYPQPAFPLDAEGLVNEAVSRGVRVVQMCDNLRLEALSGENLARLAARARRAGVTLETGTRGTGLDHLRQFADLSRALGAQLMRTTVTGELAEAEQHLRAALGHFEACGVVCALENYERHPVRDLAAMIRRIGSPFVGACLDTVNSFGAVETPQEVIDTLLPLAVSVHLKDFDIVRADHRMGFAVVGTPAGKGRLGIPRLIECAKANGRNPNAILELWTAFEGTVEHTVAREEEWVSQSIEFLRRYITQ